MSDPGDASRTIYAFRKNLVLAASAGTGKTHALVGVAVHLLMGGCRREDGTLKPAIAPGALAATTFSRKAAGEIKERLTGELERLASSAPRASYRADLLAASAAATGVAWTDEEIAQRARTALRGLGRAKIGTLHGFAAQIARAHALALGLSPDFDLPDEETTRERTTLAIERVLAARVNDDDVAALLRLAGGVDELIELLRELMSRVADDGRGAAGLRIADDDASVVDIWMQTLLGHARDLLAEPKFGEPARAVLSAYERRDADALEIAVGDLCSVAKTAKKSPAAEAFFEFRDELCRGTSGTTNREHGVHFVRRWRLRDRMLPQALALRSLLVACEAEVAEDNAKDSVLSFADVLRAARDVLRDHPFVAAETGASFAALLVDEFQDTSGVQRDLVQLLWERDRRGETMRAAGVIPGPGELRGEGLLVVGDRKQSIYGFRGADVAVFAELAVGLAGAPARDALAIPPGLVWEPSAPSAEFIALRHNRRGEPELLDFANACSRLSLVPGQGPPELYEVSYVPETEDLLPPVPRAVDAPRTLRTHWLRVAVNPPQKLSSRLDEARVMAARIGCIVQGGELTVAGAPVRFRDVAILAQRHGMLDAAAFMLAEAGIPHVVAGMGFYRAREVRDVVAMLALLVDPSDSLARLEVLRGPWTAVTDRTLVALTDRHAGIADVEGWSHGERRALLDPRDRAALTALAECVTRLRPIVHRLGPGAALRDAVRALRLEETLILMPRGEQLVANVRKLLALGDAARDPTAFLQHVRRAADEEHREGEAAVFSDEDDAVRLLTVHASKGLAFPIVFLPEAGAVTSALRPPSAILEPGVGGKATRLALRVLDDVGTLHDTPSFTRVKRERARRDAAEARRKRYVAVTRASEAMFFVGDRAVPKAPSETYRSSTASILVELSSDDGTREAAGLAVETGETLFRQPPARATETREETPRPPKLTLAKARASRPILLRIESIEEALHCTRRFELVHADHQAPERPSAWDASSPAWLTRTLASAGDWGARLAEEAPRLLRNERVVLSVPRGDASLVAVEATLGLLVAWADGAADTIAFRAVSSDDERDDLFASVVAHGARERDPSISSVRVGFLDPEHPVVTEPRWRLPRDLSGTCAVVRESVDRILASSRHDLAPRVDVSVCLATGCPFLEGCYPSPVDDSES